MGTEDVLSVTAPVPLADLRPEPQHGGIGAGAATLLISNLGLGGAERQIVYLAAGLKERGWSVSVVSMTPCTFPAFETELESLGIPLAILQESYKPSIITLAKVTVSLLRFVLRHDPKIMVAFMPHALLITRVFRKLGIVSKVISSPRTVKARRGWRNRVMALTGTWDDGLVASSEVELATHIRAGLCTAERSYLIRNIADLERASGSRTTVRTGAPFHWLHIGVCRYEKDQASIIRAAATLSKEFDFKITFVGDGPDLDGLKALADRLAVNDFISFAGTCPEVSQFIANSDAFVMSSMWEALPNVIIEAHLGGLPVVATRVGGVAELVLDGMTGFLVPPEDPVAFADAMASMMRLEPSVREQMGRAGAKHILAICDREEALDGWERALTR